MSLSKNFIVGASTGVIGLGIKTLLNILVYPYLLQKLGLEQYGLYVLLLNMVDLIILMDLGLTSGMIQRLSTFHAQDTEQAKKDTHQMLSVGLISYSVLAVISFVISFCLIPFIPGFFNFGPHITEIASFCLYIILFESALTLFQGYFSSVLMSHNLYQWVNTSESLYFILANGSIFILLHLGYGLKEISMIRLGAAFIKFSLVFFHAVRKEPACIRPVYFNFKKSVELVKISLHAMVRTVSDIFSNRMDLVLIGRFMSLRDVAIFEFVFRFLNIIAQIPTHIAAGIFPIFTRRYAQLNELQEGMDAHREETRLIFTRISNFIQFFVTALIIILCMYYPEIFTFFSGGRMAIGQTLPLLMVAIPGIVIAAVCMPASHYLFAIGRFSYITKSSIVSAVMKILVAVVLIRPLGLVGVIVSTLLMELLYHQYLILKEACREMNIPYWRYIQSVYMVNIPSLLTVFLSLYGLKHVVTGLMIHPLLAVVLLSMVSMPLGLVVWFMTTASTQEKTMVRQVFEKILARIQKRSPEAV